MLCIETKETEKQPRGYNEFKKNISIKCPLISMTYAKFILKNYYNNRLQAEKIYFQNYWLIKQAYKRQVLITKSDTYIYEARVRLFLIYYIKYKIYKDFSDDICYSLINEPNTPEYFKTSYCNLLSRNATISDILTCASSYFLYTEQYEKVYIPSDIKFNYRVKFFIDNKVLPYFTNDSFVYSPTIDKNNELTELCIVSGDTFILIKTEHYDTIDITQILAYKNTKHQTLNKITFISLSFCYIAEFYI